MARMGNRNSLCTKALAISDAMSDELHALEDQISAAKKARDKYLHEHPVERRNLEWLRDTAPMARSNVPFSIFADTSRDPR
jgi:hypothetical protein